MALTYGLREAEATFWKKSVHDLNSEGSLGNGRKMVIALNRASGTSERPCQ
ncbi:MAG: hypothetical protein WAN13_15610 [Candidatus Acidiferrales bacterium]